MIKQNAWMVDPKATFNYSSIRFSAMDPLLKHYNSVNMDYLQMVNCKLKQCSVAHLHQDHLDVH